MPEVIDLDSLMAETVNLNSLVYDFLEDLESPACSILEMNSKVQADVFTDWNETTF